MKKLFSTNRFIFRHFSSVVKLTTNACFLLVIFTLSCNRDKAKVSPDVYSAAETPISDERLKTIKAWYDTNINKAIYLNSSHLNEVKSSHVVKWNEGVTYSNNSNEIVAVPLRFLNESIYASQNERYLTINTSDWTARIVEYKSKSMTSSLAKTAILTQSKAEILNNFTGQVRVFSMSYILDLLQW